MIFLFRHDWIEVTQVTGRDHSFTVPNLKEDDHVAFRIRAVNAVGPSEPSRPTDAVLIQDQPGEIILFFRLDQQLGN